MVDMELSLGPHNVLWCLDGYADMIASITVADAGVACDSVTGGACYTGAPVTAPGVLITAGTPFSVTGYLKESAVVTDFDSWVESKGGVDSIEYADVLEMGDAYLEIEYIGFTPTYANVLTTGDYYLGL